MRRQLLTIRDDEEPTMQPAQTPAAASDDNDPTLHGRTVADDSNSRLEQMRLRLSVKDYEGALVLADSVLTQDPDQMEARECRLRSEMALEDTYLRNMGSLDQVPHVVISPQEVCEISLDNRLGFLLSRIDGVSTLETLLSISGMGKLEAIRALSHLINRRVVKLSDL